MVELILLCKMVIITFALTPLALTLSDLVYSIEVENKIARIVVLLVTYIFSCSKCFSFWFSLVYTQDLFIAACTSVCMVFIERVSDKYFATDVVL